MQNAPSSPLGTASPDILVLHSIAPESPVSESFCNGQKALALWQLSWHWLSSWFLHASGIDICTGIQAKRHPKIWVSWRWWAGKGWHFYTPTMSLYATDTAHFCCMGCYPIERALFSFFKHICVYTQRRSWAKSLFFLNTRPPSKTGLPSCLWIHN